MMWVTGTLLFIHIVTNGFVLVDKKYSIENKHVLNSKKIVYSNLLMVSINHGRYDSF